MTDELKHIDCGEIDEADALKTYCDSHVRCGNGHHRLKVDEDRPCPVCRSLIPYLVEAYPNIA